MQDPNVLQELAWVLGYLGTLTLTLVNLTVRIEGISGQSERIPGGR
jgi:hypothetical protein